MSEEPKVMTVKAGYESRYMVEDCRLCGKQDAPIVLYGLSILGIEYPGQARFICDDCISKIKDWL